jgi:putative ABC transport system permease protein
MEMFKNFIKTAVRFLWRNKTYSVLNYLCLTFGLTCAIVAVLNISRVLSYDKFHTNYDRLYEVEANVTYFNGDRFPKELLSASMTDLLKDNVPELESVTRIANRTHFFVNGPDSFPEAGIYADPDFLEIFSFPLTRGEGHDIFYNDNSIIISEGMAIKFFKSTDCLGKTLIVNDERGHEAFTISGVMKNVPSSSSLRFDFIIPFSKFISENRWALESGASASQIWALLMHDADVKTADEKIKNLIKGEEATLNQELFLFPLKEKILYYYSGGRRVWREMQNLVIIGCIGFAILLISCFNFINLTIALNIRRYREAAVKKVFGAKKSSIILQHLGESFIITLISLITALDLVRVVIDVLNRAFNGDVKFNFSDFGIILFFAGIAIFTALVSGLLPALYLSSSKPVNILKGKPISDHSFSALRKGLIIFQFTIPIVLIIFVLIIKIQDSYIRNYDLGFDKNRLLVIASSNETEAHAESIRTDLLGLPGIESVSFTNCVPARGARVSNEVSWEGKNPSEKLHFWCINADYNYDETVNIEITDGRYFDISYSSDSTCFLINDVAAKAIGYEKPLGRTLTLEGRKGTIIGEFKNFHTIDLTGPFTPTIISLNKTGMTNMLVKINSGDYSEIQGKIKDVLNKYEPGKVIQPYLYSDLLKRTELTTTSNLVGIAFMVSILLACMGLAGLASFTAVSRTKEIGIRKINGASAFAIMRMLGINYSRWLTIASFISLPVAFILGSMFLSRFNFRTPMPYWTFIAGPAIAFLIALTALSWQSWRSASRNPADALRYE